MRRPPRLIRAVLRVADSRRRTGRRRAVRAGARTAPPRTLLTGRRLVLRTDRLRALRTRVARDIRVRLILVVGWGTPQRLTQVVQGIPVPRAVLVRQDIPVPRVVREPRGIPAREVLVVRPRVALAPEGHIRADPAPVECTPADPEAAREVRLLRGPSLVIRRQRVVMRYMLRMAAWSVREPMVPVPIFTTLTAAWISIMDWMETGGSSSNAPIIRASSLSAEAAATFSIPTCSMVMNTRSVPTGIMGTPTPVTMAATRTTVCTSKFMRPSASTLLGSTVTRTVRG
jgi:hypothetical protein